MRRNQSRIFNAWAVLATALRGLVHRSERREVSATHVLKVLTPQCVLFGDALCVSVTPVEYTRREGLESSHQDLRRNSTLQRCVLAAAQLDMRHLVAATEVWQPSCACGVMVLRRHAQRASAAFKRPCCEACAHDLRPRAELCPVLRTVNEVSSSSSSA